MNEEEIALENKRIAREYKELLRMSYRTLSDDDKELIRRAFDLAVDAHKDQRRKSGEAYIFHPIAVAKIVAKEIGMDATSIAAALLHDVVEDTEMSLKDIERMFGETIAKIVDGLTKLEMFELDNNSSQQAENFRKMLLTLNEDIRVIIIKISDRLHNMQTMESMPEHKRVKIASETLYIYAPLAHRLGLYNIKSELEDLGLKYTEPEVYEDISRKIKESKEEQEAYITSFSKVIEDSLNKENLDYQIFGRPKSVYSIRRKMIKQNISFDEVYDKFAIRIIYKSEPKDEKFFAWKIYSIVTDHFRPNPVRLRDWITSPKSTGYEALHITVMGPKNQWVEVQIRSQRMHEIAEKGYAAHYKYKTNESADDVLDNWLAKIHDIIENQETNAVDFVEDFKLNLYAKEIFVFTPDGELKSLPKGATALDFAFAIHTDLGIQTRGAKVNGKLKPLSHELKSGDMVEIISSQQVKPNANWLDFVVTGRAKSKIKSSLNIEKKRIAEEGKELLTRKLKALKITFSEKIVTEMVNYFKLHTSLDLFYRVGIGTIDNQKIKEYANSRSNRFVSYFKSKIKKSEAPKNIDKEEVSDNYDLLVFGKDQQKLDYKLSACCNPIPGDNVFGFLTVNEGVKVHKYNCPNAISLQSKFAYRILPAKWIDSSQSEYNAILILTGIDRKGLVNEITQTISGTMNINIKNINFDSDDGVFNGKIALSVKNLNHLNKLIENIKKVNGIDKVIRE